jgi:hypothetical protein
MEKIGSIVDRVTEAAERNSKIKLIGFDPLTTKGFVMFPKYLYEVKVSTGARLLYALLLDYGRGKDECWPGQADICEKLQVSPNTLRGYMQELTTAVMLKAKKCGRQQTNHYFLLPPKLGKT